MSSSAEASDGFTIRPAEESDVALLLAFIRELAEYERLEGDVAVDEPVLRRALFGSKANAEALIAFVRHEPAGFAVFFENFSTFLGRPGIYLEDLFVRPAFRRRGVGRGLLEHLAREANQRSCGRFEWAVLDWNKEAIAFYESLGAGVLSEWRICRLSGEALERFGRT